MQPVDVWQEYAEHSTHSAADFLCGLILTAPFSIREIQTDNGPEFTNALLTNNADKTLQPYQDGYAEEKRQGGASAPAGSGTVLQTFADVLFSGRPQIAR